YAPAIAIEFGRKVLFSSDRPGFAELESHVKKKEGRAMSDSERPIVIKRVKKKGHGAHAAAWKIAYADFVTAMMAFFLLMWLLGSTTKGDLQGIAEYFRTPLKVALEGGSGSGDSASISKGGGTDLTRTNGQQAKSDMPVAKKTIDLQEA